MISALRNLATYRELILMLAWRNIAVQYKQAYLGIAWAVLKPVMLMLIFTLVRSFVGIESGNIPYPILTFAALLPWTFFQDSVSQGVASVVGNASLVRKIYFPREIFPVTATIAKLVELGISFTDPRWTHGLLSNGSHGICILGSSNNTLCGSSGINSELGGVGAQCVLQGRTKRGPRLAVTTYVCFPSYVPTQPRP